MNSIKVTITKNLHKKISSLKQTTIEECDFILFFCFIVSRAGTDINAALDQLNSLQVLKPVILVVLHHTFDIEKFIPDSNRIVNREQILAVDCLFNEDERLLQCQRNNDALDKITKHLQSQKLNSYSFNVPCFNGAHASPHQSIDQDERSQLISSGTSIHHRRIQILLILLLLLIILVAIVILIVFLLRWFHV